MNNYVNHFISYCYIRISFLKYSKKCKIKLLFCNRQLPNFGELLHFGLFDFYINPCCIRDVLSSDYSV